MLPLLNFWSKASITRTKIFLLSGDSSYVRVFLYSSAKEKETKKRKKRLCSMKEKQKEKRSTYKEKRHHIPSTFYITKKKKEMGLYV